MATIHSYAPPYSYPCRGEPTDNYANNFEQHPIVQRTSCTVCKIRCQRYIRSSAFWADHHRRNARYRSRESAGSGADAQIAASYFRYLVFKNATWKAGKLNFDSDVALAGKTENGLIGEGIPT